MSRIAEILAHRRHNRIIAAVNQLEPEMRELDDDEIPDRYIELRRRRRKGVSLNQLTPETFALMREATRRAIGIRQYDVQLRVGAGLAEGAVAELKTGEGKTFAAPLAAALFGLDCRGVHILTANDYLAGRDRRILEPAYQLMGLSVASVLADTPPRERSSAYSADITYTTVVQIGFGFLRQYFQQDPGTLRRHDMWQYLRSEIDGSTRESRCLRGRHCAILDEADSILIDYARQPLSLSVQAELQRPTQLYPAVRTFALENLRSPGDFELDKIQRSVELTDKGKKKLQPLTEQYGHFHLMEAEWEERAEEALRAEHLFKKGTHYVVKDGIVVLVDDTSGRLKIGQRLGGELHQALEAKEGVKIHPRQQVAKKITIQSLIRPYDHLAGMTGTAWEARAEFNSVYSMKTLRFSPRLADQTRFHDDMVFLDSDERWDAVARQVEQENARGRPVLVGTRSVDASQHLSELLEERGIEHDVLNAVNHTREAEIIAEAGERGKVTVATNMAGRGAEIKLGEGVKELGGLHVLGTERHALHRLDRQLAGRTGRRGQPGSVQFCACVEDDVFEAVPERTRQRLENKYSENGRLIPHRKATKLVRNAQSRFSDHFARVRKSLLVKDLAQEEGDKILFGQDKL